MPFVDPVTREKVKFNPDIIEEGIFPADMVMKEGWGGSQDFEYVHEKYWPDFVELCESRAKNWMKVWRELGGKVGTREWEYKQGNFPLEKREETNEKEETVVMIEEVSAKETLKKEVVNSVPHIMVDATEPVEYAMHHAEDEGQSVAIASAVGAIAGGVGDSNAFNAGHVGDDGGD